MFRFVVPTFLLLATLAAPAARAQQGNDDLASAVEAKLTAENFNQLGDVIRQCQTALEKGLEPDDQVFCKRLMASALIQRAVIMSQLLLESGRTDQDFVRQAPQLRAAALTEVDAALSADPLHPEAHYLLARLNLVPGGDAEKAKAALDEALKLYGDEPEGRSKTLTARAALETDPEKRLAMYGLVLEINANQIDALRARGALYLQLRRNDEAIADFERALEIEPAHAATIEARGATYAALGKTDQALDDLAKAIELAPHLAGPYAQRAQVHLRQQQIPEALADLDKAIERSPTNPALYLLRAGVHQVQGEKDKALQDLTETLHVRPNLPQALRARAALLSEMGKIDEAIADLDQLLAANPRDAESHTRAGALLLAKKNLDQSISHYTSALNVAADNWLALQGRADALVGLGRAEEALSDYEAALKLQPQNTGLLNNLAWLLATSPVDQVRDGKRAVELATEACKESEYKVPHILSTLAAGYAEAGDFKSAIEWSSKAVESSPAGLKESLEKELETYKAGKPWREEPQQKPQASSSPPAPSDNSERAEAAADAPSQQPN
jgi:tetratricopeptide (TPR) repeat protein